MVFQILPIIAIVVSISVILFLLFRRLPQASSIGRKEQVARQQQKRQRAAVPVASSLDEPGRFAHIQMYITEKILGVGFKRFFVSLGLFFVSIFQSLGTGITSSVKWAISKVRGVRQRQVHHALKRQEIRERVQQEIKKPAESATDKQRKSIIQEKLEATASRFSRNGQKPTVVPEESFDPKDKSTNELFKFGEKYRAKREFAFAISAYQEIISRDSKRADAHIGLGHVLFDQEKLKEAKAAFDQAILADSFSDEAFHYVGKILSIQGFYKRSLNALRQSLNLDEDDAEKWYDFGVAHQKIGEHEEALSALLQAAALDSSRADVLKALVVSYKAMGKKKEAKALSEQIRELKKAARASADKKKSKKSAHIESV
jgi:tetratricopeptide (TPR) repeat protein